MGANVEISSRIVNVNGYANSRGDKACPVAVYLHPRAWFKNNCQVLIALSVPRWAIKCYC